MTLRPLPLLVVTFAALTLACGGGKDGDDTGGGNGGGNGGNGGGDNGGGDTDTDTDGDTDTDSDTDSDTDADPGGPCPDYSGLHDPGATWDWGYTRAYTQESGVDGGWTTTLRSLSGAGEWVTEMVMDYTAPSVESYTATYRSEGYCDTDGAFITFVRLEYHMVASGRSYDGWSETTYSPPALSIPAGLSAGDSFDARAAGTSTSNTGTETPFDITTHWTVGDPETVDVPAGTFTALPMSYTAQGDQYTSWVEADLGGIASDVAELEDYTP